MNSLTVSSVCDHSSSVYLDPTSTGTVRQPATDLKYSMLCGREKMNELKITVILQHDSLKKKPLRIPALLKNMSYVHFWMSSSTIGAESQMPRAVCQVSQ